ncbi:MAG: hypothetical protein JSV51_08880 [Candidatus Bathyarchaeota archaeon]|nr:MAG: hypothetical protein JSV51_08880 [Candidatus Bathyarchaeota archaeon]
MKVFLLVLARDNRFIKEKIAELAKLNLPFLIVCGEISNHPNVVYRKPIGKYDAINYGLKLIPNAVDIVALNDVDTKIWNFPAALEHFKSIETALVFTGTKVTKGPQRQFYNLEDAIRRRVLIAADGELMLIRKKVLDRILPLKPCKAEDTYILFSVLERRYHAVFCEECYVETERTKTCKGEEEYKKKVVTGIYQALSYTRPPSPVRAFYIFLPLMSALLLISGKSGYYWMKGILLGFLNYLRGDRRGYWKNTYME